MKKLSELGPPTLATGTVVLVVLLATVIVTGLGESEVTSAGSALASLPAATASPVGARRAMPSFCLRALPCEQKAWSQRPSPMARLRPGLRAPGYLPPYY